MYFINERRSVLERSRPPTQFTNFVDHINIQHLHTKPKYADSYKQLMVDV